MRIPWAWYSRQRNSQQSLHDKQSHDKQLFAVSRSLGSWQRYDMCTFWHSQTFIGRKKEKKHGGCHTSGPRLPPYRPPHAATTRHSPLTASAPCSSPTGHHMAPLLGSPLDRGHTCRRSPAARRHHQTLSLTASPPNLCGHRRPEKEEGSDVSSRRLGGSPDPLDLDDIMAEDYPVRMRIEKFQFMTWGYLQIFRSRLT